MKHTGTISIGVKMGILRNGDDLINETVNSVKQTSSELNLDIENGDVITVTESILARTQGNYVSVDEISNELKQTLNNGERIEHLLIYQPVLSRNRFAVVLKALARASRNITIIFTCPTDEVGNEIMDRRVYLGDMLEVRDVYANMMTFKHPFTGINYIDLYSDIVLHEKCTFDYVFCDEHLMPLNRCINNLPFDFSTVDMLICNVHDREIYKSIFSGNYEFRSVTTLGDYMTDKCEFGLLGCNKVNDDMVKLFPTNSNNFVRDLQKRFLDETGKKVECMVYGDGGFKCPVSNVWEELDPVISPGFTDGLNGTPNEIKLKAFADDKFNNLSGDELKDAIKEEIKNKPNNMVGNMMSQGTTPRNLTDLLGSLADLTSGSGDKGTPVVWIKNYFKNFKDN